MNVTLPGQALPADEHFGRRFETLLDEAEQSRDYEALSSTELDAMERKALELLGTRNVS